MKRWNDDSDNCMLLSPASPCLIETSTTTVSEKVSTSPSFAGNWNHYDNEDPVVGGTANYFVIVGMIWYGCYGVGTGTGEITCGDVNGTVVDGTVVDGICCCCCCSDCCSSCCCSIAHCGDCGLMKGHSDWNNCQGVRADMAISIVMLVKRSAKTSIALTCNC